MKIQYLGTGAAEGTPAMFCQCRTCQEAFQLGGKNIRTRAQSLVDDKILIDLPGDTYMHFITNRLNAENINMCLITHNHGDHFYPREMTMRRMGYVELNEEKPIEYYATAAAYEELFEIYEKKMSDKKENENRVRLNQIYPFKTFTSGGYKITPLNANHNPNTDPVIYIIEKDGKALLYGHDTGRFSDETWDYLKKTGICFGLVSLDSTYATLLGDDFGVHMNLKINNEIKEKMISLGFADGNTIFVANHFSHKNGLHNEIEHEAKKVGFLAAYDGMIVEF